MKGTLAQRPAHDILGDVRRRQESGILRFEHGGAARQLFIDAGITVRFAASNVPGESITALFKEKGGITDDMLRQATAAKQPEELLGTTLARLGFMTRRLLAELTNEHIRRVVRGALDMREGTWEFQAGALPFREQLDGGLSGSELLLHWSRTLTDVSGLRARLGSLDVPIEMARRPPEGYQKIPLTPAEGYTMSRVDGRSTLREICLVSPMGEEVALRALFGLCLAGILELPGGGSAEAAPGAAMAAAPAAAPRPAAAPPAAPRPAAPRPDLGNAATGPPAASPAGTPRSADRPAAPAPQPVVLPGRTPGNGGAPRPPAAPPAGVEAPPARSAGPQPAAPRPAPAGAQPAGRPAPTARPGAAPGRAGPGSRPARPAAPRKVIGIRERVRPATAPDLEQDMLQRFERMHQQDLYQVLDTPSTASADDIRRSYYTLAKRFHPDKFTREEMKTKAEKVFGHITEAYSTLSREASRKKYDEDLAARQRPRTQERVDSGDIARQNYRHGRELLDRGRFGEAVSFLQNAVEQDPSKAEYVFQLALAQSKNPRWKKEAEENFLSALRIDPTNAEFYAQLGALYARGGVHSKAREMFRKALEWDPDNAVAREGLDPGGGDKKGLLGMFKK